MIIDGLLEGVKNLAISGHIRPDGDSVGSGLALYNYVKKNYPEIDVVFFLEKPTGKLAFIDGYDRINSTYEYDKVADLFVSIDVGSKDRLGNAEKFFDEARHTVCIDHHLSNVGYADENFIFPDASSACEVLYGMLDPDKIDKNIATALYTGIIYDSCVFKYPSTSPYTMQIAGHLMEYGLDTEFIIDQSFYAKTFNENRIFGYAVYKSCQAYDGKLVYSWIDMKELDDFGVSNTELENIVSQLKLTKGAVCSFFMHENKPGVYKISFRSNEPVDVSEIAARFGGGGHARASACTMEGTANECLKRAIDAFADVL